jgi:hypothetical protein
MLLGRAPRRWNPQAESIAAQIAKTEAFPKDRFAIA